MFEPHPPLDHRPGWQPHRERTFALGKHTGPTKARHSPHSAPCLTLDEPRTRTYRLHEREFEKKLFSAIFHSDDQWGQTPSRAKSPPQFKRFAKHVQRKSKKDFRLSPSDCYNSVYPSEKLVSYIIAMSASNCDPHLYRFSGYATDLYS